MVWRKGKVVLNPDSPTSIILLTIDTTMSTSLSSNSNSGRGPIESPSFFKASLAEDELLRIGRLALLSMQLPGYLPVKVCHAPLSLGQSTSSDLKTLQPLRLPLDTNSLKLFLHSFCCCSTLLLSVATSAFASFKWYEALQSIAGEKRIFSDGGDRVVVSYGLFCTLIVLTICRILFLKNRRRFVTFWTQRMVRVYESFARLNISHLIAHTERQVKVACIYFWTVSAFQLGFALIFVLVGKQFDPRAEVESSARGHSDKKFHQLSVDYDLAILIIILFLMYIHSGPVIWTGFIIQFYTNCMKAVASEIKRVSEKFSTETEGSGASGGGGKSGSSFYDRTYGLVSVSTIGREWREKVSIKASLTGKCAEELVQLIELYERVGEAVEYFNVRYGVIVLIDVSIGLLNALGFVYTVNKLIYELGDHSTVQNLLIFFRAPFYLTQVLRVVFFTNKGDLLAEHGLSVLRELQKVPIALLTHKTLLYVKVQMLVTRLATNPPNLCPVNFFTLNRTFLASLISFLVTYYIILTEFREEDEGRKFIRNLDFSCGNSN